MQPISNYSCRCNERNQGRLFPPSLKCVPKCLWRSGFFLKSKRDLINVQITQKDRQHNRRFLGFASHHFQEFHRRQVRYSSIYERNWRQLRLVCYNIKTRECHIVMDLTLQPCALQLVSVSFQYLQLAPIDVMYTDALEDFTPAGTIGLTRR